MGEGGPLFRTVYPAPEGIPAMAGEGGDFIDERAHSPVSSAPYIVQKYADRVAFLASEDCFSHCRYCFRSVKLCEDKEKEHPVAERLGALTDYLKKTPSVKEIVITGGDPLCLNDAQIELVLEHLSKWKLRLHTRAIIYNPERFTERLAAALAKQAVKLVFHINHPYEICSVVEAAVLRLENAGIQLFAQYPLLRGINDHAEVQIMLLERLVNMGIRPLSIFIVEPNWASAPFRLSWRRITSLCDTINWMTPSWINAVRVVLDTPIGKVRRENIVRRSENTLIFSREGREVSYPDFPACYDKPSRREILLWKERAALTPPR
ncbi:MAG: radical SAM protein [Spirochaetaceae bacterium]|jgi:lysine 2,3-aminomutase|nr:radical SAM protein [Spirochaetaceae bacterium]